MEIDLTELVGKVRGDRLLETFLDTLGEAEVEAIEGRTYVCFRQSGIELHFRENGPLTQITCFAEGEHEDYRGFVGALPLGIQFDWGKHKVLTNLGVPQREGSPRVDNILGQRYGWVRYEYPSWFFVLEFGLDESRIRKVAIMIPQPQRGE